MNWDEMSWEEYKKDQMEKLIVVRDHLGKALELIEDMSLDHCVNTRYDVSKAKSNIEHQLFELSRSGEEDESIYRDYIFKPPGTARLPIDGFEYVDVSQAVRIRCRFPEGMRTFYMDEPIFRINRISIGEYLDGIQNEIDQDQIME